MKKKAAIVFKCSSCQHEESKWLGRCPSCGEWNTLKETHATGTAIKADRPGETFSMPLASVDPKDSERITTGIPELDRVLGGGVMLGASVLVGGEPGIGKSTLLLQAACASATRGRVLYVSGEESPGQVRLRADRLGISRKDLEILCTGNLDRIMDTFNNLKPGLLIVDSAQTLHSEAAGAVPGTVNQMKYCVYDLADACRERGTSAFFVAHVTKEGVIAGPKAIEHMVDAVLYFEQAESGLRFLRPTKNRFGSTEEIGIFSMGDSGLRGISDASALFLERRDGPLPPGSATVPVYEGSRVLLVEIQALTVPAKAGLTRVYSERVDSARVARLAAVLEKQTGIRFSDQDVYVNVAGGFKPSEPATDLAVACALYSARTGIPMPDGATVAGEVSLAGEIRTVPKMSKRAKTSVNLGHGLVFGPKRGTEDDRDAPWRELKDIKETIKLVFGKNAPVDGENTRQDGRR